MLRKPLPAAAVGLAVLALAACGGDDETVDVPTATGPATRTQNTQTTQTTPTRPAPAQTTTPGAAPAPPAGGGSGGTPAPGDPGGSQAPSGGGNEEAQQRFEEFCRRYPDQCAE